MKRLFASEEDPVDLPTLPLEVWSEILSWLHLTRVLKYVTICKTWYNNNLIHRSVKYLHSKESFMMGGAILRKLVNLVFLEVNASTHCDLEKSLPALVNLEHLSLYWAKRVCNATIKGLTKLSSLSLNDSRVDHRALIGLPSLTSLSLGALNKGIIDAGLSMLTSLTFLSMYSTWGITGTGVSTLVNLRTLNLLETTECCANFNQVSDETLSNLTNLTTLTLDETSVTDAGLGRLVKLESLSLFHHYITNKGIDKLSSLTELELWHSSKICIRALSPTIGVTYYPSHEDDTQTEEEDT